MRRGDFARAVRMLQKSLELYPLPGVEALLAQARGMSEKGEAVASVSPSTGSNSTNTSASNEGSNGRTYSSEHKSVVERILKAKEGGRGAHYRVLELEETATDAQIKKAYRKISLKVHPDKNAHPHADEAFKAVGLAYATLSDSQKRTIYDRYGEEDPDNRGGGMRPGGFHGRPGQEMSPEDIFNMFFHGGMPGGGMAAGGPGFHFYSTGFGPGMQFRAGGPRRRGGGVPEETPTGIGSLIQFLPFLLILITTFLRFGDQADGYQTAAKMPGEDRYFSLTHKKPFVNPLSTTLSGVREIPYFVSDKFLRLYHRDRYQLAQVERMVEKAYENYLLKECNAQTSYKHRLEQDANRQVAPAERARKSKIADEFELRRCDELYDLFPRQKPKARKSR